jgi:hypothetical protein
MSVPAGSILTIGGLNVIDRLQDAGLQDPKVPTETIRETGNNLVVGKVLEEPDFSFKMSSLDVSCDMMALLNGKKGTITASEGPSHSDAAGTEYHWETCGFINLTSPWKRNTGTEGGAIEAGVIVPTLFPKSLSYKFGVKDNATQEVTLQSGSYFMDQNYPMEEFAAGTGSAVSFETAEEANVYRVGGHGSTEYQWIFGVMVNGVIQIKGVDYEEEGGEEPGKEATKVKIIFATAPANLAVIRFCYFSTKSHSLAQAVNALTTVTPAAVRGRDIEVLLGDPTSSPTVLRGVQDISLQATWTGDIQRELGNQEVIGNTAIGTDCNGSINIEPKEIKALYTALSQMIGIEPTEIVGAINQFPVPLTIVIRNPTNKAEILKSIFISDALFQPPGETAKVNTSVVFPVSWESELGTFTEVKGQLPS